MSSTYFQIASTPLPTDLPARNYGGSDVPAFSCVKLDTTNVAGAASGQDAEGIVLTSAVSDHALGVTVTDCPAGGDGGRVRTLGAAVCIADGNITVGDVVGPGATTPGRVATCTSGPQLGICTSVAGGSTTAVAGDQIRVWLQIARNS